MRQVALVLQPACTWGVTVTSTIRPSGRPRVEGEAASDSMCGAGAVTITTTVPDAAVRDPSCTSRVRVWVPTGRVTVRLTPTTAFAGRDGPVQMEVRVLQSASPQ